MATVNKAYYKPEANVSSFPTDMKNLLRSNTGQMQDVGAKVATNVAHSETNLIEAYALDPGISEKSKQLGKKLELKDSSGKFIENAEGIQEVLKLRLSRALRSLTSFDEIMNQAHQMIMRIIQSIRVG